MVQRTLQLECLLEKLKLNWPKPMPKKVRQLFGQAQKSMKNLEKRVKGSAPSDPAVPNHDYFNFVDLMSQVLKSHDLLFLSRQLTYHVVTMSDLPLACGSSADALSVLTEVLTSSVRRAHFSSKVEIQVRGGQLRGGPAVEVRFVYEEKKLSDKDRQEILEQFYGKGLIKDGELTISSSRSLLRRVGGQLWLEFEKKNHVALTFYWPAFDSSKNKVTSNLGTYKYDVSITDYAKIRQRFGVERGRKLTEFVEAFVKSLVRHPVDMVLSFPEQGMITVIYEAQEGTASSVSHRISGRLKKEIFRLGRKNITPHFRYQLAALA